MFEFMLLTLLLHQGLSYTVKELETSSDAFEGDIELSSFRNAVNHEFQTWPDGMVPYDLGDEYSSELKDNIRKAMDAIEIATEIEGIPCIVFWPRMGFEKDWVKFKDNRGCSTMVGRAGNGEQYSFLAPKCAAHFGVTMHELLHTLGFWHEQNRSDRDDYIDVKWDNIEPARRWNFRELDPSSSDNLGTTYDYDSILHYGPDYFQKKGISTPTIVPKNHGVKIGQRDHLSATDIEKIRKLYDCTGINRKATTPSKSLPRIDTVKSSTYNYNCDFENNKCAFLLMSNDKRTSWQRVQGKGGIGPPTDHTTAAPSGWFMVIDGSKAPDSGNWARLLLTDVPESNTGYCVSYWYNVYGIETGYIRTFTSNPEHGFRQVADDIGDRSGIWKYYSWHFDAPVKIQVAVDVLLFGKDTPDTAVDDFKIVPGKC